MSKVLNDHIDTARSFVTNKAFLSEAMAKDQSSKANFALKIMERQAKPAEPVTESAIPRLGAYPVCN